MKIACVVPEIWSMKNRIFFILQHFWPFYPTNNPKNEKKSLQISSFYKSGLKIMIKCYTVPEIWFVTDVIFIFHFRLFFFLKMNDIIILHLCTKNYDKMMYGSWDIACNGRTDRCTDTNRWRDRQMDRQKRWHIEVGVPPKKIVSKI